MSGAFICCVHAMGCVVPVLLAWLIQFLIACNWLRRLDTDRRCLRESMLFSICNTFVRDAIRMADGSAVTSATYYGPLQWAAQQQGENGEVLPWMVTEDMVVFCVAKVSMGWPACPLPACPVPCLPAACLHSCLPAACLARLHAPSLLPCFLGCRLGSALQPWCMTPPISHPLGQGTRSCLMTRATSCASSHAVWEATQH